MTFLRGGFRYSFKLAYAFSPLLSLKDPGVWERIYPYKDNPFCVSVSISNSVRGPLTMRQKKCCFLADQLPMRRSTNDRHDPPIANETHSQFRNDQ